jgi:stearoyl-CoA desaturase (delta-9 desaturase)
MLTHRSFEAHPVVRCILLVLGSMAAEGPALDWAAIHIKHHAKTDRADDPHSPLDGFFHAHIGGSSAVSSLSLRSTARGLAQ